MPPWFRKTGEAPFVLARRFGTSSEWTGIAHDSVPFPFGAASRTTINRQIDEQSWASFVSEFEHVVVVTGKDQVRLLNMRTSRSILINLPKPSPKLRIPSCDHVRAIWALCPPSASNPSLDPLIVLAHGGLLYVFDVRHKSIITKLRGHGGSITALAAHPTQPHIFASTSRDHSTRIYDLTQSPKQRPDNRPWPNTGLQCLGGPSQGLDMSEIEGEPSDGLGRCVIVLMGLGAGGHSADVLNAEFHPSLPLIATCGIDRKVKIWHVPKYEPGDKLLCEDKPLFSTNRIHASRVLSVSWLSTDILVSHGAPIEYKVSEGSVQPGQICIWQWLSVQRFFPPGWRRTHQQVLRGCASDYEESSSFHVLSTYSLPHSRDNFAPARVSYFRSPCHDPLALITYPNFPQTTIFNLALAKPEKPIPWDECRPLLNLPEPEGLSLTLSPSDDKSTDNSKRQLVNCRMVAEGNIVLGTDEGGSIWAWVYTPRD